MTDIGILRAIREDELELMLSWRNAPPVRKNMYTRHEITIEEHRAWWLHTCSRSDQKYFMYELAGNPSGIVGITAIDLINSNCAWAFYASSNAVRGVGTRMEVLALDHVFHNLMMHKLYCEVLAFNASVIRLHQKFGFQVEGVFREHHKLDESFVDIHRLGLLASEWAEKREAMLERAMSTIGGSGGT